MRLLAWMVGYAIFFLLDISILGGVFGWPRVIPSFFAFLIGAAALSFPEGLIFAGWAGLLHDAIYPSGFPSQVLLYTLIVLTPHIIRRFIPLDRPMPELVMVALGVLLYPFLWYAIGVIVDSRLELSSLPTEFGVFGRAFWEEFVLVAIFIGTYLWYIFRFVRSTRARELGMLPRR